VFYASLKIVGRPADALAVEPAELLLRLSQEGEFAGRAPLTERVIMYRRPWQLSL
jgi:hypothetical protein